MTTCNHSESCGVCHSHICGCDKKRKPNEALSDWLERIGFQQLTDEQRRRNLEENLDWFLK